MNLAARLDEMAEAGETLLSDALYRAVDGRADCEALGERRLKGLPEPVRVWRLRAMRDQTPAMHRGPPLGGGPSCWHFLGSPILINPSSARLESRGVVWRCSRSSETP